MSSIRQIEANRRNSQLSTGPRTPEGKAVSRFNALKSGMNAQAQVIPGEDPEELESLIAEYHNQFQPATALARFLVDALVSADWQIRRLRRVEAELWAYQISSKERFGSLDEKAPLGNVFDYNRDSFTRLQRRIDSAERSFYRALTQLQRLNRESSGDDAPVIDPAPDLPLPAPDPWPLAPDTCPSPQSSKIGFVLSTAETSREDALVRSRPPGRPTLVLEEGFPSAVAYLPGKC